MPELGGFTVSIEVDGQALEEHAVQKGGENDISCHIVSVPGQTFKIKIQNESPFVDEAQNILACALPYIDGLPDTGESILGSTREDGTGRLICTSSRQGIISGFEVSEGIERELCFSRVHLTEDSGSATKAHDIDAVGTIQVEIRFNKVATGGTGPSKTVTKPEVTLSERTKKGGGHCTALGSEILFEPTYRTTLPCPTRPKYTFTFRHASKDWLQAKEIITPPPPKSTVKVTPNQPVAGSSRPLKRKTATTAPSVPQVDDPDSDSESLDEESQLAVAKAQFEIAKAQLAIAEIKARAKKRAKLRIKAEPGTSPKPKVIDLSD